ncbi:MAG: hypothetical protein KBD63_01480 [Bacteriovoracaceae bacterium]|nr:hypothetical protein [Bacteriovoracaceae bacterium]
MKMFILFKDLSLQEILLSKDGHLPQTSFSHVKMLQENVGIMPSFYVHSLGYHFVSLQLLTTLTFQEECLLCEALGLFWPLMPSSLNISHEAPDIPSFDFLKEKNEIIFFAGSFNPWHQGHLNCLKLSPDISRTLIILDSNPQKNNMETLSPWQKYLAIKKSLQENSIKSFIYPSFACHPNPTYPWLKIFEEKNPTIKISFLMGDDAFFGLPTWFNYQKLKKIIKHFYVVPRIATAHELESFAQKEELSFTRLADHPYKDVSSSHLRKS